MRTLQTTPYMLHNEEGQLLEALGATVAIKATSAQTGGAFNIFEITCPPGFTTPLNIHYAEDVAICGLQAGCRSSAAARKKMLLPIPSAFNRAARRMGSEWKAMQRRGSYA